MTPEQFRTIRINAGLSVNELADVLRISDGRSIRRYEDGSRAISGPIALHMERIANGQFDAVQWQPIETAPKDGTNILVSAFHDNGLGEIYEEGGKPDVVHWSPTTKRADDGAEINWVARGTRLRSSGAFSPTHWMPLPEPPQ